MLTNEVTSIVYKDEWYKMQYSVNTEYLVNRNNCSLRQ